nr:nuclear transport factor 2 family protein [Acidobacteriota bacterium]
VWPSVDRQALQRAFGSLREQRLTLEDCALSVRGDRATARCSGTVQYRPQVGSRTLRELAGQWTITLKRGARGWAITHVDAR